MKPIKSIVFVVNLHKLGAESLAESLQALAEQRGVTTRVISQYPLPDGFLSEADACCVIGGDGSLLEVVSEATKHNVPVLGVNLGKLGFMATFSAADAQEKFAELLEGDYAVYPRTLIACKTHNGKSDVALNDVVIKSSSSRLIRLRVFSNDQEVNEYYCDGLIFSTPTGSTAYNLSAGGPLVHPRSQVIAMTPICPHTLSNRSVIFDQHTHLKIVLCDGPSHLLVSVDGHDSYDDPAVFPLDISISEQRFLLIQQSDYTHFKMVRQKLGWGNEIED